MPSPDPLPLTVDLDVLKKPGEDVTLDDVERAVHALTGWQAQQRLVDQLLDVVETYARGARAGRVPRRLGHDQAAVRHVATPCGRAHLDDHVCPAEPTREVEVTPAQHHPLATLDRTAASAPPLARPEVERVTPQDAAALAEAAKTVEPSRPARRVGARNVASMTPAELLLVDDLHLDELTEAQRAARHTLMMRSQHCSSCGTLKSLDDFYRDKARLTGHASRCKDCANAATRARRQA